MIIKNSPDLRTHVSFRFQLLQTEQKIAEIKAATHSTEPILLKEQLRNNPFAP